MNTSVIGRFLQSNRIQQLQIVVFAIIGFIAGFICPLRLTIPLRYDFFFPLIIIFIILWATLRLPHPWDATVGAAVIMMLFSGSLAALWRTGTHGVYEVFGLIPWFDSSGYYSEALRLLDGGIYSQISARRPIFPALFSSLLLITGRNLRLSLLIMTLLAGVSTWILVKEIKLSEKKAAFPAVIVTFFVFYYRKFNGAVLTDTLGFSLGVLGLTLLWNSINNRRLLPALVGLFCFTLGQSARPGAVFSLPLLLIWVIFFLKTDTGIIKKTISASAVVVCGLLINIILTNVLAPEIKGSYSNFASLIYGLVNGGVGWHQVYVDHPEFFASGNEGYAAQQIYQISWQIFINDPGKVLQASFQSVQAFFSIAPYSAFNYLDGSNTPRELRLSNAPLETLGRWGANILLILLLPISIIARKNQKLTLLLALNLGVILSLPFAPPWDIENMRAYAVSIGGLVTGIFYVLLYICNNGKEIPPGSPTKPYSAYTVVVLLLLGILFIPLLIRMTAKTPVLSTSECPPGKAALITQVSDGSFVSIGENSADLFSIPYPRFLKNLDQFPDAVTGQHLKSIPDNSIISQQNDASQNGNAIWLVGPINLIKSRPQPVQFCGHYDQAGYSIFYAESVIQH